MGRRSFSFTDEQIAMIEQMAGIGLSIERMAGVLGISERTFHNHKNAKINAAIEKGKGKAAFIVGKSLFREAESGNVNAIKWWEATRENRSEKIRNENTGETSIVIKTEVPDKKK